MALTLAEHWVWDFWFAQDGDDVHLFFLHAPRSLGDHDLRHWEARIGHAVSTDLHSWDLLPPVLPEPPRAASADDRAMWTGSVVRNHDDTWWLFYTGLSHRDGGPAVQRIIAATSSDLLVWNREPVLVEADPRWYETWSPGMTDEHWRDPWVFWDRDSSHWHMFVTARSNAGPSDARGVIGHAQSPDLRSWEVLPPVSAPGEFRQMEVPQLVHLGGRWRVLFSAQSYDHSALRLDRTHAQGGTHVLIGETKLGPYRLDGDLFLVGDPRGRLYAGRMLNHAGTWSYFAWEQFDDAGRFVGRITDPMPVRMSPDGDVAVEVSSTAPDEENSADHPGS